MAGECPRIDRSLFNDNYSSLVENNRHSTALIEHAFG